MTYKERKARQYFVQTLNEILSGSFIGDDLDPCVSVHKVKKLKRKFLTGQINPNYISSYILDLIYHGYETPKPLDKMRGGVFCYIHCHKVFFIKQQPYVA